MTREDLHILIEKYFAAETSIEEERLLKELLPMFPDDPEAQEAIVAMGMANIKPASLKNNTHSRRHPFRRIAVFSAAACALLLLSVAITRHFMGNDSYKNTTECVAYISGERINDRQQVENLALTQLKEIGIASESTQNEARQQLIDILTTTD